MRIDQEQERSCGRRQKRQGHSSSPCGPSKARAADGRGVCRSGFCGGGVVSRLIDKGRAAKYHLEGCCRHRLFRLRGLCSAYKKSAKYTQDATRIVERKKVTSRLFLFCIINLILIVGIYIVLSVLTPLSHSWGPSTCVCPDSPSRIMAIYHRSPYT